jgi:hypothetical protein
MILNSIIDQTIDNYLSDSEQYSKATIELEQFLDSILFDTKTYSRFTRFIMSEGIFLKILVTSDYFTRSIGDTSINTKIRVGFYKRIMVLVDIMQEDHILIFKNSKKRMRDNKIDQIISNTTPIPPVFVLDLKKVFQSSSDDTSPQDTKE